MAILHYIDSVERNMFYIFFQLAINIMQYCHLKIEISL